MFSIVSSNTQPQHLKLLRAWCLAEWSHVDSFACTDKGITVPAPLVAVFGQTLIGGLAFTAYPVPGGTNLGVWINVLIVAPEHRGKGVGSRLIVAAEAEASRSNATALFVYSKVPRLYQNNGWVELSTSDESSVLQKVLSN
jgi:GNAT superfamily N-acetyltransferase